MATKNKEEIWPVIEEFMDLHFKDIMAKPSNFLTDYGRFSDKDNAITTVTLSTVPAVDAIIRKAKQQGSAKL